MFCVFKNKIPNNKLKSLLRQLVVFVLYCSNCSKEELYTTMLELNRYIMFQQPVYNIVVFFIGFLFIYLFLAFFSQQKGLCSNQRSAGNIISKSFQNPRIP